MAGNCYYCMEIVRHLRKGWNGLEKAGMGENRLAWAGIGWNRRKLAGIGRNWLKFDGICWNMI